MEKFDALVQKWFQQRFTKPTEVQRKAWPLISKGEHVLVTAPTGSGKTLTAFLWSVNQLISGNWEPGRIRVLYVSPLKALNNDIARNLLAPLAELNAVFESHHRIKPQIRVAVRSGDTPQDQRRRMLQNPPEILITTPETLNNLLTSRNGRSLLTGLATVIIDEIHAVAGTKRGTHLITAVDRLVEFSGEFQRIALSATVKPEERIAAFVGGFRRTGPPKEAVYEARPVAIVKAQSAKQYDIRVDFPDRASERMVDQSWWPPLIEQFKAAIRSADAALFFANSRRLTEKITRLINEEEPEILAYAHHGSLAKELRLAVEQKLKRGELNAIVATSSLELGIDVGGLTMVGLVQTPMSVSSAVQRVGRAGHGVDEVSRGVIYPTFGLDFVCAAAMAKAVAAKDVEAIVPVEAPLDVLTQVLLSMACHQERHIDELYAVIKSSYPYRRLSRKQFDLVIAMLTGRYADLRVRELTARLTFDRLSGMVTAGKGTDFLIYLAGGTIADRGYFNLRLSSSRVKIGELDEEFVWERAVGDVFAMGSQVWRVHEITPNDVLVEPAGGKWDIIPFWKAEVQNRDSYFSEKAARFLELADENLERAEFADTLCRDYHMTPPAARQLIDFLRLQKDATGTALPHRRHLLIEHVDDPAAQAETRQVILHTLWGGRLNRPFALALSAAWEQIEKTPLQVFADNDGVVLMLPSEFEASRLFEWVTPQNLESLLIGKLESTGFFGALFRENAGRALLLPKQQFNQRMPLWLNRLRAKKLLKAVRRYPDFPILLETVRTCLQDEFDLADLKHRLQEIQQGRIAVSRTHRRRPSPFAAGLVYRQTDLYMYSDDTPLGADGASLKPEYIRELLAAPHLRPQFSLELVTDFQKKLQRSLPGYAPESDRELLEWLKERLMIPADEWEELPAAAGISLTRSPLLADMVQFSWPGAITYIAPLEIVPRAGRLLSIDLADCRIEPLTVRRKRLAEAEIAQFRDDCLKRLKKIHRLSFEEEETEEPGLADFVGQWLSYYGPLPQKVLHQMWGLSQETAGDVVHQLTESGRVVVDIFSRDGRELEICDSENLERLLYLHRQGLRPTIEPRPVTDLPPFIAELQGIGQKKEGLHALQDSLERLFGLPLPAAFWEEAVWPARVGNYQTAWLDTLFTDSELVWFGCGEKKLAFAFHQDLELFKVPDDDHPPDREQDQPQTLLPSTAGKFSFFEIVDHSRLTTQQAGKRLWAESWQGRITNDGFAAVRKGIRNRFKADISFGPARPAGRRRVGRGTFNRWKNSRPLTGSWYALPQINSPDPLEASDQVRDRVRQLLLRYGIIFRQLLARELPLLQWRRIFAALRLMEFSGEVFTGRFFSGIPGLQFASKEALARLQRTNESQQIYWLNAADPASLCGIDIPELKSSLPSRRATTFLVYMGYRLVVVAERSGRKLEIAVEPDHPRLLECFKFFRDLLNRDFNPVKTIVVEQVNGENVLKSPYVEVLREFGFEAGYNEVSLRPEF